MHTLMQALFKLMISSSSSSCRRYLSARGNALDALDCVVAAGFPIVAGPSSPTGVIYRAVHMWRKIDCVFCTHRILCSLQCQRKIFQMNLRCGRWTVATLKTLWRNRITHFTRLLMCYCLLIIVTFPSAAFIAPRHTYWLLTHVRKPYVPK